MRGTCGIELLNIGDRLPLQAFNGQGCGLVVIYYQAGTISLYLSKFTKLTTILTTIA